MLRQSFCAFLWLQGVCLISIVSLKAQSSYFQQAVNYKIEASLDDQSHMLKGNIEIQYTNHAPKALDVIWMHLWANAFKNTRTAYCKQTLREGNTRFYFSSEDERGYYKELNFTVDQKTVSWCFDPENPDIALIELAHLLQPGETIHIQTPFLLKIPASFSRLGHVETSYQMTQWYPKPAVYDQFGWHAMPYLDLGEFYSEFGNFEVTLTLPENYVVGASGVLQTASEIEFLSQKAAETKIALQKTETPKVDSFPISHKQLKTIQYRAEKVHDFAWFADKRFLVIEDTALLESGKNVNCWAMFTPSDIPLWKNGARYIRRAVEFYSKNVGEYPWPQATAVHSALSAGGGMEYPMVTVIGNESDAKSLDEVIAHEVGHNWFYGILATNERDHPFMDEGLNSYYEQRYMDTYYKERTNLFGLPKWLYNPDRYGSIIESGLRLFDHEHTNIPPDTHSNLHTQSTYGLEVYMKTAWCMNWLEKAVGTEKFDATMQAYYQKWKFKHPYPDDLRAAWLSSGLSADWWFETMQTRKQADYVIAKVEKSSNGYSLDIRNNGDLNAPFPVTALLKGKPISTIWFPANDHKHQIHSMPCDTADAFILDYDRITLDPNRQNNTYNIRSVFPRIEPLRIQPFAFFQVKQKTTLGLLPWASWNEYNKTMVGLLAYNPPGANSRFQYYLAPAYSFGTKNLAGLADLRWRFFPGGWMPKVTLGLSAKQFAFAQNASSDLSRYTTPFNYQLQFQRLVPQIRVELKSKTQGFRHQLSARAIFINQQKANFQRDSSKFELLQQPNGQFDTFYNYLQYQGKQTQRLGIYELRYEAQNKRSPNPYHVAVVLETQPAYTNQFGKKGSYVRSTFEWKQQFFYKPGKNISARFFAGAFLQNSNRDGSVESVALSLNPQGFNDYRYDQVFFGRTETSGFISRQVSQTDGGFKSAFGKPNAGNLGNSNSFVLALNLKADLPQQLPLGIPIKPWFDIGYFDDATSIGANRPLKEQILWSGGLLLELGKGVFEMYFPLINSGNMKNLYAEQSGGKNKSAIFSGGNYLKWISWSIRVPFRDPGEALETFLR